MIRYITRHGQVSKEADCDGDHMFPSGDYPLSPLGRKQAVLLGKRLREMGFIGRILVSPFRCTLETACLIAEETGSQVTPFAPIREIIRSETFLSTYNGLTMEEIRAEYTNIDPQATLPYPWWSLTPETPEDVTRRVQGAIELAEQLYPEQELLFVGHGASSGSLLRLYGVPKGRGTMLYNCSLSAIDPQDEGFKPIYCDCSHMPYTKTTSNFLSREENDVEHMQRPWPHELELPAEIKHMKGKTLLHIGNTASYHYPYFFKLIEEVKPDILLHTGDMADEVRVGRIPGTEYEYLTKIKVLIERMRQAGAERLIIVPGNNDLPDAIARLAPEAEIYPWNTRLTIDGVPCRVGHPVFKMTYDTDWSFYGHGFTKETWHPEDNRPGQPCRFNVSYGSFVCCLSEGTFHYIPYPWKL